MKELPRPEPKRAAALFKEFQCIYGAKVQKAWEGVKLEDVLAYWERELSHWTDPEIAKAVTHLRRHGDFPPTMPEFITICRDLNRVAL